MNWQANWIGEKYFLLNKAFLSEISFWYVYLAPCLLTRYLLPTEDTGFSSNLPDSRSNGLMCFCFSTWEGTFQNQQKVSRCPISPSELGAWGKKKKRILFSPSFHQFNIENKEQSKQLMALSSLSSSVKAHIFQLSWLCINEGIVKGKEKVSSWFSVPYVNSSATGPLHYGFLEICASH